ncbi:NADH-quinone oxidoreductase subunit E [Acidianus hospitalis]|uniref:NADH-quinone oxidoreductase subunit E n=1 Tax=Acidianus hospitalis TaxID=563177 RepID=A0A2T9X2T5_9CREN|nr:NADH-quinone oxidoreductase subunit E [Acidianus hospitalis]
MSLSHNIMREDILEFLMNRRSIRSFQKKDVDNELLKKLIYVANHAPNSMNREPWKFIIIRDEKTKEELSKLHKGASHLSNAPVNIAVVGEPDVSPDTWMVDVVNATMYFVLSAYAVGLGVGWVAAYENETAKKILGIPKEKVLVTLLSLGYPDSEYKPKPKTVKSPEEVILYEKWS